MPERITEVSIESSRGVTQEGPRRYAGVLARHGGRIVLVREEYPTWGGPFWNIPSGRVEDGESPAEGAARELAEETGLVAAPGDLVLQTTCTVLSEGRATQAWNYSVVLPDRGLPVPALSVDDPDELIQEARWFTVEEAVGLLGELPYRPLSEPALAILGRQVSPGTHWTYPDPAGQPSVTPQD